MMPKANAPNSDGASRQTAKNIAAILKLEREDDESLSPLHRLSHTVGAFVGTIYFAGAQCIVAVTWILLNAKIFNIAPFDPYPFSFLSTILALEAVLLTSFVLIRQNTIDRRSERRNHLNLQINLLAEKEATSILNALGEIADHLNVKAAPDAERVELAKDTPVESIAQDLRAKEQSS